MLPGFRSLFAAIAFAVSVLLFALGAAALLRSAHEEFAHNPSWHATPEIRFAQKNDRSDAVLAMLRIEPPPSEPEAVNDPAGTPVSPETEQHPEAMPPKAAADTAEADAAVEAAPATARPAEPPAAQFAVTAFATVTTAQPAEPKAADDPVASLIAAAQANTPSTEQTQADTQSPASADPSPAPTKVAPLGGPAAAIERPQAVQTPAEREREAANKRLRIERAKERRRLAQSERARLARQAAMQQANPFAQTPFAQSPFAQTASAPIAVARTP